ncbi:MAG: ABC transporter ATP-binding protein [Clostridiales bacterium]|nr:ABC transporter ATP-binding protein [Clostridiales bacterium]
MGKTCAVRDLSLSIGRGEIVAVAGESGCGKSVLCKTIMGLLPKQAEVTSGSIVLSGRETTGYTDRQYCQMRGSEVSIVFQDPFTSLDPTYTIGSQITEAVRANREDAVKLMEEVGIDRAEERFDAYPWMLSGGMRQRCVLAMALSQNPKLLIADEPTTALDEDVKNDILNLLLRIRDERNMGILFITHDLSAASKIADRLAIMYAGKIIEIGTAEEVINNPAHPYTWGLLHALPAYAEGGRLRTIPGSPPNVPEGFEGDAFAERNAFALGIDYIQTPPVFDISPTHKAATWLADERAPEVEFGSKGDAAEAGSKRAPGAPLLKVRNLSHYFKLGRNSVVKAVEDVSFEVRQGEILGLVGRSGSGKTTLARCILGMYKPMEGNIIYDGIDVTDRRHSEIKQRLAREIQFISQDPGAALDSKMTVRELIAEPLKIHNMFNSRREMDDYIRSLLREVGIDEDMMDRYPHELSGGQRQRVSIARAYGMDPKLLICDEPLASLDVSIQAQIVELFRELQKKHGTAMIFIAHDLEMVRFISDRIARMNSGQLTMEEDRTMETEETKS